ncbi:unnamed protein product [Prorocentrum cordatum]|uniref:Sulfotransferase n=1 Tax=Prorocentrum cordatum TaxID=2364126 RepID=A0ABN9SAM0_9DINO|nr:unnamed protein product [Polarella glacialis]
MLPTWLSDLRGASLGLLLACAAHAAGWRCAPLVYGLLGVCSVGFGFSIAFYVHTTRVVFNRKPNRSLGAYYQHFMLTRPLEAAWRFLTAPLRVLPDFHILGETRTGTTTLSSYLREIGCIGAFSPWIVPFASDKDAPRQKLAVRSAPCRQLRGPDPWDGLGGQASGASGGRPCPSPGLGHPCGPLGHQQGCEEERAPRLAG